MGLDNNQLHMTVGTGLYSLKNPAKYLNAMFLHNDVNQLKAAILYADKVTYLTYGSFSIFANFDRPKNNTDLEKIEWYVKLLNALVDPLGLQNGPSFILNMKDPEVTNTNELIKYIGPDKIFKKEYEKIDLFETIKPQTELLAIFKSGIINYKTFSHDESGITEYYDLLLKALSSSKTYTVLDEPTNYMMNKFQTYYFDNPSDSSERHVGHSDIAINYLRRLPLFNNASVDEIIDIRKELEKPLTGFRSAMISYSKSITNCPWTSNFEKEVNELFLEEIAPTILEIEDAYKSNTHLLDFIANTINIKSIVSVSLGLGVTTIGNLSETLIPTAVALGGVIPNAYFAIKERKKEISKIESNKLFFYYKAEQMIKKKYRKNK